LLKNSDGDRAIVKEIWEMNVYRYYPQPGHVVVDIGAHRGVFATWAALHGALVFAFEPCRKTFEDLVANVQMNHLEGRVRPQNLGIWSKACALPLYYWPDDAGGNSLVESTRTSSEQVLCTTLEDVFRTIRWCDFLKIDCEGAEFEILQYVSDEVLAKVSALSAEIHSPALDPGGREHPVKFTAYDAGRYQAILARLSGHFNMMDTLKARNNDPNYLYCRRAKTEQW
jgi:FkbM family methyltransferase